MELCATGETSAQLPEYQCHKKVRALAIAAIQINKDKSANIAPAAYGFAPFTTRPNFPWKGSERDLGFYVVYDDGYESWSPTKAFMDGYTRI